MKKNIDIVMLGDSITGRADWNKLLSKEHILNLGLDGDTTSGILNRIDSVVELSPNIVFFMAGINDLCSSIPLEKIFENYKEILNILKLKNINVVVQSTLFTEMHAVNKKVKEFNFLVEEYCKKESFVYMDINLILCDGEVLKEAYSPDGLHLNFIAYHIWANEIKNSFLLK